jgi:retron-type reverse transcriptase
LGGELVRELVVGQQENAEARPQRDENLWVCKYGTFFDPDIYEVACRNLRCKGKRRQNARVEDDFVKSTVPRVIEQMRNRSFQFQPVESETMTSADGKHMRMGRPSFTDEVVQEVYRLIVEPVFAHARPGANSAYGTLQRVRTWTGTTWVISVNSPGLLNNLDHSLLGSIVMSAVKDQQLLDLYWKLVKAGLVSTVNQERHNLTGVSKGGILWPLFTDAYLSGFDVWLKEYASSMSDPRPTLNPKPGSSPGNEGTKVHYIRYGDQWLVGVDGPKSLAVNVRDEIRSYLNGNLNLQIEDDCFTISHLASEKVKFLGVLIGARDRKYVESLVGERARRAYGRIFLEAPINEIVTKLVEQGFAENPEWPRGMSAWIHLEAEEILGRYMNITKGLMEYYSIVDNKNMMRRVFWILRFSAAFTLCRKWRMSTRALFKKLANDPHYEDFLKGRMTSR